MDGAIVYLRAGGIFMVPILLGSVWAVTLIVERFLYNIRAGLNIEKQLDHIANGLSSSNFEKTKVEIIASKGIMYRIWADILLSEPATPKQFQSKMEASVISHAQNLGRYLNTISMLAGLMPILGLLGTVTGMVATFAAVAQKGAGDPQVLGQGISQALITTQAGLVAAIPIILGHNYLANCYARTLSKLKAGMGITAAAYTGESHAG